MRVPPASLFDRAFRGLTPAFVGLCAVYLVFDSFFSWGVAITLGRGKSLAGVADAFVRMLAVDTLRFLPFFAGVAVFNLVPGRALLRGAAALAVIAAGTALAMYVSYDIDEPIWAGWFDRRLALFGAWVFGFTFPALFALVLMLIAHEGDARSALERQRLQVLELDRGLAQARLKVTQAQIEPHFLFNTLANVRRLYAVAPESGRAMLQHFTAMLASTLPAMRGERSTLHQEAAYATAYLSVQQIRMGDRLRYTIDIPAALGELDFPPMMLLTLVENAIKHGLAPLPEGGSIALVAAQTDGTLEVSVIDSGRGLGHAASGSGVGLANIEARLRAMFGAAGRLLLEEAPGGGVSATIGVPIPP